MGRKVIRKKITCSSPDCENSFLVSPYEKNTLYYFCSECRKKHSYNTLIIQAQHRLPIRQILIDSALFSSVNGMAAYLGVSFVTIYNLLKKYFNMTFQEFKRQYICKKDTCYSINVKRSSYSRHDYILRKIKNQSPQYCACMNVMEPDTIMTNAPLFVVQNILRGCPKLALNDGAFSISTVPFYFRISPLHFRISPVYPTS